MAITGSGRCSSCSISNGTGRGNPSALVMIEVLPPMLSQEPAWTDFDVLSMSRVSLDELPLICRYHLFLNDYARLDRIAHCAWYSSLF